MNFNWTDRTQKVTELELVLNFRKWKFRNYNKKKIIKGFQEKKVIANLVHKCIKYKSVI